MIRIVLKLRLTLIMAGLTRTTARFRADRISPNCSCRCLKVRNKTTPKSRTSQGGLFQTFWALSSDVSGHHDMHVFFLLEQRLFEVADVFPKQVSDLPHGLIQFA